MVIFLSLIIVILSSIIFIQYKSYKERSKNLKYVQEKLNSILKNKTDEKIMIFTSDKELKEVLEEINNVLDYNQKLSAGYTRTETSMRKMLSNISHDLKTPLTVVLGYIETLSLDKNICDEETHKTLLKVYDKTTEVLELINKFFDLAKLESGDKHIEISRININEICKKTILEFYDILISKDLEVDISIPEDNIYVFGNEEALDRILNNLISNAIKYGSDGGVIGLKLRSDEELSYIDIWDKGKGINELHKEKVFERMYTLEDSRNKLYQGSGLGLTITKRLVEKLGGEITLKSKPYEKTVFSIKLKKINY